MKTKAVDDTLPIPGEPYLPYAHSRKMEKWVNLLVSLLENKTVARQTVADAGITTLVRSGHAMQSAGNTVTHEEKAHVSRQLFTKITQNAVLFKEISKEPGKIIYGDPAEPDNTRKQITYLWSAEKNKWLVIPGEEADAIIPNEQEGQLIIINVGKATSYGKEALALVATPPSLSQDSLQAAGKATSEASYKELEHLMGKNLLHVFSVPPEKKAAFDTMAGEFLKQTCPKARNIKMIEMETNYQKDILYPLPYAAPYEENGNHYIWFETANQEPVGIKIAADKSVEIVLSTDNPARNVGVMVWKKANIAGITSDLLTKLNGFDLTKGFIGGDLLRLDSVGEQTLSSSTTNDATKCLIPTHPDITKVRRLSAMEMTAHLSKAREAGWPYVSAAPLESQPAQQPEPGLEVKRDVPTTTVHKRANTPRPSQSRISEGLDPKLLGLKVATLNGVPLELHCAFTEKNCVRDGNFTQYEADVFVFKRPGSVFPGSSELPDSSEAIIIEVTKQDPKEVIIRPGYVNLPNGQKSYISAAVTYQGHVAAVDDKVKDKDGNVIIKMQADTPFKTDELYQGFMCIDGCCSHYTEANRNLIKNPSAQLQK